MTVVKLKPRVNRLPQTQDEATKYYREPDEFMTILRNVIEEDGRSYDKIAAAAMCHYQTVKKIAEGDTRYPANSTCDRILKACGYHRELQKVGAAKTRKRA